MGSGVAIGGAVPLLAAPSGAPHLSPKKGRGLCRTPLHLSRRQCEPFSFPHPDCLKETQLPEAPWVCEEPLLVGVMGLVCPRRCWTRSSTFCHATVVVTAGKFWAQNSVFNDTRERLTRKLLQILKTEGASHVSRSLEAADMMYLSEDKINWIVR